ncbi:hypothetical protein ACFLQR_04435 [Verrucomicrobiota bacterium]
MIRIIDACKERDIAVEFTVESGCFIVCLRQRAVTAVAPDGVELNERQKKALEYVRKHERITRSGYEELNHLPPHTAKRDLRYLVEKRVLVRKGAGRKRWYELRDTDYVPQMSRKHGVSDSPKHVDD